MPRYSVEMLGGRGTGRVGFQRKGAWAITEKEAEFGPREQLLGTICCSLPMVHSGVPWRTRTLSIFLCHTSDPQQLETQCFDYMTSLLPCRTPADEQKNPPGLVGTGRRFCLVTGSFESPRRLENGLNGSINWNCAQTTQEKVWAHCC